MTQPYYPPINDHFLTTLKMLVQGISSDALVNAPYAKETREFLRKVFISSKGREQSSFTSLSEVEKAAWLEQEAADLYLELAKLDQKFEHLEVNEQIQAIKTQHSLLEKLTSIQERSQNLKLIAQFQEQVMCFVEENLTADQFNEFINALEKEDN